MDGGGCLIPDSENRPGDRLRRIANALDESIPYSVAAGNYGGTGAAVQAIEDLRRQLCPLLHDLSSKIDIISETTDRLAHALERLPFGEAPIVFMEKEPSKRGASPFIRGQKDGIAGASNMSDCVDTKTNR